jgi:hypothetical protein
MHFHINEPYSKVLFSQLVMTYFIVLIHGISDHIEHAAAMA